MTKKTTAILFVICLVLFFGSIFYRNISTFNSLKGNTGYTFGIICKVWDDKDSWYSRYQYNINGKTYQGRQGGKHILNDTVIIVYDTTAPRFSMIASYDMAIVIDSNKRLIELNTEHVHYKWWDYLPGDEVHSIKDLWSLE